MEGGRKRRKLQNVENERQEEEEEEEDEDGEEKMKLFFALIQNTKAMRDQIKSKESAQEEKSKGVWNPKFQPEDFMEDCHDKNKPNINLQLAAASSSNTKQSNQKEEEQEQQQQDKEKVGEEKKGLDLNLSL